MKIVYCLVVGHDLSRWRIETEDWFDYVDAPIPGAWHTCRRCALIEEVMPR